MKPHLYILVKDERSRFPQPKKMEDFDSSSNEFLDSLDKNRRVALTSLNNNVTVSTVFLGADHDYSSLGPPLLFETMVFTSEGCGNPIDDITRRYSSWEDAEKGHYEIVRLLKLKAFW